MLDTMLHNRTPLEQFIICVKAARLAGPGAIYVEACPFCWFAVTTPDRIAGVCGWCGRFVWFVGWRGWRDRLHGLVVEAFHGGSPATAGELVERYRGWCEARGVKSQLEDDDDDDDEEEDEDELEQRI